MTRDAIYQPATRAQVEKFAIDNELDFTTAAVRLGQSREKFLAQIRGDPYNYGFEPGIWYVVKALQRGAVVTKQEVAAVRQATGLGWDEWSDKMRRVLGFTHPVSDVLIMGANRSGKTDFGAKSFLQEADIGQRQLKVGFQEVKTGKEVQMKRLWHYMRNELKARNIAGKKMSDISEHISYTEANGFAGSQIIFKNGSNIYFITYKMDVGAALEGMEHHKIWLDEEEPKAFLDAARGRVASLSGSVLLTFTPVSGYTSVVADFLEGMRVTRWHTAYMLPLDGGPAMPWAELGLGEDEYRRLVDWGNGITDKEVDPCVPESRPEECFDWILGHGEPVAPGAEDRRFAQTPRVAVCKGGEAAAIWFLGRDNPYGTPREVIANAMKNINATKEVKKRVYGIAEKLKGRLLPEFTDAKNVVPAASIPKRLARIMVVDPAPDRNWTFGWLGYDPVEGVLYAYREWPSAYEIPGVGVPGPWAVASDRKNGINDGDKGDAQESFGMGFDHYKYEWARLEGWNDYTTWAASHPTTGNWPEDIEETVADWSDINGAREKILKRVIDPRACASKKTTASENVSLFEHVSRMAEGFEPGSGQRIEVGLNFIRDLIVGGRLKISDACPNTIFAFKHITGADGQKGACKDMLDWVRYGVLSGVTDYTVDDATEEGEEPQGPRQNRRDRPRKRAGGL